ALCAVLAFALVAAACGSDDSGEAGEPTGATSDMSEKGDPVHGGSITVGLEAETNSWLPGSGNFGNPGVTVAYAIYDPLMKRSADGEVRPYLAESLEPNGDLTEWTLTLREGIEFHDGTPLDA